MKELLKFGLQFFAEGEGSGGDGGQAESGDGTVAAEQKLRELGVPEALAKKRASKYALRMSTAETPRDTNVVSAATEEVSTPTEEKGTDAPTRLSWEDIKKDPEYKKAYDSDVQSIIKARFKEEKPAKAALDAMIPAIEVMARKYGLDSKNMDYTALAKAIEDDDAYYEDKAMEMGTSVETAKRVDIMEREAERRREAENVSIQQQQMRQHFIKLEQQGEALKATFPTFDLRAELNNPQFARLVDPRVGLSVEDAYHAVHRKEIQAAQMQYAAQKTAESVANSIASGSRRPDESGTTSQAPSVSTFDYRNASREQRDALKKQIYAAKARGEKVYPR